MPKFNAETALIAIELQQLQLTRTGDANMPAARISGNIVMVATAGAHP